MSFLVGNNSTVTLYWSSQQTPNSTTPNIGIRAATVISGKQYRASDATYVAPFWPYSVYGFAPTDNGVAINSAANLTELEPLFGTFTLDPAYTIIGTIGVLAVGADYNEVLSSVKNLRINTEMEMLDITSFTTTTSAVVSRSFVPALENVTVEFDGFDWGSNQIGADTELFIAKMQQRDLFAISFRWLSTATTNDTFRAYGYFSKADIESQVDSMITGKFHFVPTRVAVSNATAAISAKFSTSFKFGNMLV